MLNYSVIDVLQNLTRDKRALLSQGELSLLMEYIFYWNNHGRDNNKISPRNSAIYGVNHISKKTFYKQRKRLEELGFISVNQQKFIPNKKGRGKQGPSIISLADWLIKSNKVICEDESKKNTPETKIKVREENNKPITIAELNEYGKELAVQIKANGSVYPRMIDVIKEEEATLPNDVIKSIRKFVYQKGYGNNFKYYLAIIEDVRKHKITNLIELEQYNPELVGKPLYGKQRYNKKESRKRKIKNSSYHYGKRVEKGTDWSKKKANTMSDEKTDQWVRKELKLNPTDPWPKDYIKLSPQARFAKLIQESWLNKQKILDIPIQFYIIKYYTQFLKHASHKGL